MSLWTDFRDYSVNPFTPKGDNGVDDISASNPENKVIVWNESFQEYGFWLRYVPTPISIHPITATGFTQVSGATVPAQGQFKLNEYPEYKQSWCTCNSADVSKTVPITDYKGYTSVINADIFNLIFQEIKNLKSASPNPITSISKTSSGKIFEWNGTNLTQFSTVGTGITVSSGEIVINDTDTAQRDLIVTGLTVPTKFEYQVNTKQVGTGASTALFAEATELAQNAHMSFVNSDDSIRWGAAGVAETIETQGSDITNVWILGKMFIEQDTDTPENSKLTPIVNGVAKTPITNANLAPAITRYWFRSGASSSGESRGKNLVISKDRYVTVNGLPTGYKARIGITIAIESGGTAKVDGAGIAWGSGLTIDVLDSANTVKATLTPVDGIHGGDVYTAA